MSEGAPSLPATGQQIEVPGLLRLDPMLGAQRSAIRDFLEAERSRSAVESAASSAHDAAVRGAGDAATFRRRAAAEILERVETSAQSAVSMASEHRGIAEGKEIRPAVKQANDAREQTLPALERIGIGWVVDPEQVYVPAAPDAAAQLAGAVVRVEAAVQPVINAVQELEEWRRARAWFLRYLVIIVAVGLAVWGIAWAVDRRGADGQGATAQGLAGTLSPEDERVALAEIRRTVRYIDDVSLSLARRYSESQTGSTATAYLENGTVRRVVIRYSGWVTETYYSYGDVVFRYEHLPQPSDPTDGFRYYYRAGVPVRLRHNTINLVPGTAQYDEMNADSVRAIALQQMRDAANWSVSP